MKVIKADLPSELKSLELHLFADEHIGDANCDLNRLKKRIEYVKDTPNAYCVLNGDIIDNATKTSIGDIYGNKYQPMEQLQVACDLFEPIKDKIICITHGNHENRTYKQDGINISGLLANQLGLYDCYTSTSALIFLRFGAESRGRKKKSDKSKVRKICYTIYMLHGSGGGRKAGSKLGRLEDMANIINAEIFIHSHTHLPAIMREASFEVDKTNSSAHLVDRLFVNTASNLDYGGYGEFQEYRPNSKETPTIYLSGTKKEYVAKV